ncbi:histidine triad nucleotide-binding protein [soil metagenome]
MDCIFCNIVNKKIPAKLIFEGDNIIAFDDITPQAPIHKLIIPTKHITTLNDLTNEDSSMVGNMVQVAKQLANELGIAETGYRLVFNCNRDGGQAVFHLHLHLLGGRVLTWPPG